MTSVGEILRTQRKKQGQEVSEIAASLCINPRYVDSIERDDLKDLPGVFFYKSYVRQYAAMVGLDYERLRVHVDAAVAAEDPPELPRLTLAQPTSSGIWARFRAGLSRAPQRTAAPSVHL